MYGRVFKRLLDLVLGIIALPFLLIILLIIGPIIYFHDKGPIFYNAPRLGRDGRIFKMYKLRSMKVNSPDLRNEDGSTFNSQDDSRVTKIGKFIRETSLDEMPQIINVIKGDMSIIGPRPDLPGDVMDYCNEARRKLTIRPGITGYNQAYYRNSISQRERFLNDVYYVDNLGLLFDIKIAFKTIAVVISKKNIYSKSKKN